MSNKTVRILKIILLCTAVVATVVSVPVFLYTSFATPLQLAAVDSKTEDNKKSIKENEAEIAALKLKMATDIATINTNIDYIKIWVEKQER